MTMIEPIGRAALHAVGGAARHIDDVATATGGGRPRSLWITLSAEAGPRGMPLTDRPALAELRAHFRITPEPGARMIELRLPHESMVVMDAIAGGRSLEHAVEGTRLLVAAPPGPSQLTIHAAIASGPSKPFRFEVDRMVVDDLAPVVVAGADTPLPPPHFRTGRPQPDDGSHAIRFDQRGWEVAGSSLPRRADDYVHPLTETLQVHLGGPRGEALAVRADYTGRVSGRAAEGPIAELRRGARAAIERIGGTIVHAVEHAH